MPAPNASDPSFHDAAYVARAPGPGVLLCTRDAAIFFEELPSGGETQPPGLDDCRRANVGTVVARTETCASMPAVMADGGRGRGPRPSCLVGELGGSEGSSDGGRRFYFVRFSLTRVAIS